MSLDRAQALLKIARQALLSSSSLDLWNSLQQYFELEDEAPVADFLKRLKNLMPPDQSRVAMALSAGQISSKSWLIENWRPFWRPQEQSVFILGGWVGTLALMLNWLEPKARAIRSLDIDPESTRLALHLNRWFYLQSKSFHAATADMLALQYDQIEFHPPEFVEKVVEKPDWLINTSCEHLADLSRWWAMIPSGQPVVLQNNNFFSCEEHVACVSSLEEFKQQLPLSKLWFSGELELPDYRRFMLIGVK